MDVLEIVPVVLVEVVSLEEKQDDFLRYWIRVILDEPDVFGFVVEQLYLYEGASFLVDVY